MRKHTRFRERSRINIQDLWKVFFTLGIILLTPPFIYIFNRSESIEELPVIFIYLISAWAVLIIIIFLFSKVIPGMQD